MLARIVQLGERKWLLTISKLDPSEIQQKSAVRYVDINFHAERFDKSILRYEQICTLIHFAALIVEVF